MEGIISVFQARRSNPGITGIGKGMVNTENKQGSPTQRPDVLLE